MCGITGFIDHNNRISETEFKNSSHLLADKGSSGLGLIFENKADYNLGLANRRLPTIDLSAAAAQPLSSQCGNYIITLNGTIYNFLELRETLIKYGVTFSTLSDVEVVLECYKKWGNKAFEMLDGSYAFGLLDRKLSLLLIGRDDLGAKPLYYYKEKGFFAFASEIKALLAYPMIKKRVNKNALANFFRYGYVTGEATIYQDIFQFAKGNLLTIDIHSGNSYDSALVNLKLKPNLISNEPEDKVLEKIEEIMTESILKKNLANTTIGVLLGAGYDSSTVAAILQKNQTKRIKTYTVGFADKQINEAPRAKQIAAHLKTNHHEFYLDQDTAYQIVKNLPNIFDEPIGNSSAVPLAFLASEVHQETKVLIGAEGGDELFGGSRCYPRVLRLNTLMNLPAPKFIKKMVIDVVKRTQPQLKEVIEAATLLDKYLAINACFTKTQINKLLQVEANFEQQATLETDTVKGLLIHDLHHYFPDNILLKNDRCFRYYGVENRDALLKTELLDYLSTLDPELFLKNGEQKYLLKKITHKYIPAQLMQSPKKGFVIPLVSWLKTSLKPLVDTYLSEPKLKEHNLFNVKEVQHIKSNFYANSSLYNAQKIWLLLQFQLWHEKWISEN